MTSTVLISSRVLIHSWISILWSPLDPPTFVSCQVLAVVQVLRVLVRITVLFSHVREAFYIRKVWVTCSVMQCTVWSYPANTTSSHCSVWRVPPATRIDCNFHRYLRWSTAGPGLWYCSGEFCSPLNGPLKGKYFYYKNLPDLLNINMTSINFRIFIGIFCIFFQCCVTDPTEHSNLLE